MGQEQFHLLFVCTANICRSPIAAELARLRIRESQRSDSRQITVGSAGTAARDGLSMDPRAAAALGPFGASPGGFASRALTRRLTDAADLVLTAERGHRAAVVAGLPRSHPKVFTILEFARLVRALDPAEPPPDGIVPRARWLVREASRTRGLVPPPAPGDDDVADPVGRSARDFETCATTIDRALDRPLRLMLGRWTPAGEDAVASTAPPAGKRFRAALPRLRAFGRPAEP
ncbi:hypothetical protein [Actinomadura sp. WMMA1423]|uniref:arsenate reductase/protein-tyrosine-phosphatase family protein n=1 Tax=Actinomadura sp. WMMA1423 TaxID=2591108 RepID=UPI0011469E0A|nr:hypothetical protein [Actinomadura sp. WMMA1423]